LEKSHFVGGKNAHQPKYVVRLKHNIPEKQAILYQAGFEEFVPCNEEEIARLEDWLGHCLPI